ncbi:hypothetical protein BH09BAC6_BH09BAC6_18300 [soil metagenome]
MSFCFTKSLLPSREDLKKFATHFFMEHLKKLNGRPKLLLGKRSKFINVRFTEDEYGEIAELERELGISKTELIRMRVLSDAKKIIVNSKELIKFLDSVGAEMGRIGNNINQLAKHANTLKLKGALNEAIIIHFNKLFEDYILVQQNFETALRKIIRAMGT